MKYKGLLIGLGLAGLAVIAYAAAPFGYTVFTDVYIEDDLIVNGDTTQTGTITFSNDVTFNDVNTVGASGEWIETLAEVSLTSPTVTFSATGKNLIVLTSDANQTGARPTDGTLGQVIKIRSGAGSNTIRFDDNATTMALGANITLTEAQDDYLTLQCTEGGTGTHSRWAAVNEHQN